MLKQVEIYAGKNESKKYELKFRIGNIKSRNHIEAIILNDIK